MRSLRTYGAVMTQTVYGSLAHSSFPFSLVINTQLHRNSQGHYFAEMLWLYVTVSCVLFGGSSAYADVKSVCYGGSVRMPFSYRPPQFKGPLYFTPKNGGSTKLLLDKGEAKDPRFKVSAFSTEFTDLTERDEGTLFVMFDDYRRHNIIKLSILDCAEEITRFYGDKFSYIIPNIPRQAEFLEFIPLNSVDQLKVLWNRTDPQTNKGGRGRVRRNVWEIINLSQADMGHYNFRAKDNSLVTRILLTVKEKRRSYHTMVNERLFIENPSADALWTVIFKPEGEGQHKTLMNAGRLSIEDDWNSDSFTGRIEVVHDGIEIDPVESTDAGIFEYRDPQGHLAQTVEVEVEVTHDPTPAFVYVAIIVGIVFVGIFCCCCCMKKCCKKSSSKRDESAPQTAAAPAVYYHDLNQPTGPSSSAAPAPDYSYQPMNFVDSREPTATSLEPSVYNPVNIHVNSPQPEVAPLGRQRDDPVTSLGSDFLSSNPEPTFELKGLPSAPPLSSDVTFCDVYSSDKLDFL